jgi:glucosamine--fructose-6-phosphate aminotransferase (isomerizing)
MTGGVDRYLEEILGQPAALTRAAAGLAEQAAVLDAVAGPARREPIVLTGMGSSHDACLAAASVLGRAGILATPIETAELLHARRPALAGAGLVVMVSQSGESAEAVRLAESILSGVGRRPTVLTITNGADSRLSGLGDLALDTRAGVEVCPSTMTFAGSLVVLSAVCDILAGASAEDAVAAADWEASVAAVSAGRLLAEPEACGARLERWLGGRRTIYALGRGVGLAAAEMTALSLMEAAGVPAAAMPTAEFRHGPLEIAGPGLAVVLFSLEDATDDLDRDFALELASAGAAVLLVGREGRSAVARSAEAASPLGFSSPDDGVEPIAVPETSRILAPAVAIGPLQLLARRLARARGRRPDAFALASKVTTRE